MRFANRSSLTVFLTLAATLGLVTNSAFAQGGGLGGYGGMAAGSGSMTNSGGTLAPFGGRFGAAMPSLMGGGGNVTFRPRPSAVMSPSRTSFTIGPMAGNPSLGVGRRGFVLRDLGPVVGARRPMSRADRLGVMPPNFGYPFVQPPSLVPAVSMGSGM